MTGARPSATGSRASTEPSSTVSALTGFDPARLAFTPGPWSVRPTCSGHSIYGPTGKRVAYTYVTSSPTSREQAEADAALIVRAPELHEENEALIHDLERVMMRENCYLNALMLISGMRGKAADVACRALYGESHEDEALAKAAERIAASGMSASGRDRETGHEAKPASPTGKAGDAQSEDPQ